MLNVNNNIVRDPLKSQGFTLIELLVVIAIISLLVSILLPSLQTARDLARSVVCASKMRDFGTAGAVYVSENDDWLPYAWDNTTHGGFWCAPCGWATIYGLGLDIEASVSFTNQRWQTLAKQQHLYLCPSITSQMPQLYFDIYSYGMNINFGMNYWGFPCRRVDELNQPYCTVMIIDVDGFTGDGASYYLTYGSESSSATYSSRHNDGLNVLFSDGRVEHKNAPLPWYEESDILWRF